MGFPRTRASCRTDQPPFPKTPFRPERPISCLLTHFLLNYFQNWRTNRTTYNRNRFRVFIAGTLHVSTRMKRLYAKRSLPARKSIAGGCTIARTCPLFAPLHPAMLAQDAPLLRLEPAFSKCQLLKICSLNRTSSRIACPFLDDEFRIWAFRIRTGSGSSF